MRENPTNHPTGHHPPATWTTKNPGTHQAMKYPPTNLLSRTTGYLHQTESLLLHMNKWHTFKYQLVQLDMKPTLIWLQLMVKERNSQLMPLHTPVKHTLHHHQFSMMKSGQLPMKNHHQLSIHHQSLMLTIQENLWSPIKERLMSKYPLDLLAMKLILTWHLLMIRIVLSQLLIQAMLHLLI